MRYLFLLTFVSIGCSDSTFKEALFTEVGKSSGIDFTNELTITEQINPYTFRNFFNGAGVAVGDINNDGLIDVYFAGNQVDNKLYLNLGQFKFEDITLKAGVACHGVWSTGVTMADVNADGWLDIYVCKSGDPKVSRRNNELFINNGDLTFTERSKEYGLDFVGLAVQAAFFDFDKDDDLDCYLLTNSIRPVGNYDLVKDQRKIRSPEGNKFLINENGRFFDASTQAGIYSSDIGFGLGITLGDFNDDSWVDIFISNDFFERDYLYINNQDGSFRESLTKYFSSISMGSMGADFADLDNDGWPELFVTEMLPDSLSRRKSKMIYEGWDRYQQSLRNGYHHQFPRNVLQKRISENSYVEIGRFAGVAASEWSWGALLFDMDNDGYRDIFIANGISKDLLDRDYLAYTGSEDNIRKMLSDKNDVITRLVEMMPASQYPNYAFINNRDLTFTNRAQEVGLGMPMYSSGSAYADLDNDFDLDLVINNINAPASVFRNNADSSLNRSICIAVSSKTNNTGSIGSRGVIYSRGKIFSSDNFVSRGFQSSVQSRMHFGLGNIDQIDSLIIYWPSAGETVIREVKTNTSLVVKKEDSNVRFPGRKELTSDKFSLELVDSTIFKHKGNLLVDFNRERLLPFMYSNEVPAILKGDLMGDDSEEIYMGGGKGQASLVIRYEENSFLPKKLHPSAKYDLPEETQGAIADFNGDGHQDLYMAAGGRFFPNISSALKDRIFINNGFGNFTESPNALPFEKYIATSVVAVIDFDNDLDIDLIVGERFDPFAYGIGGGGYMLENDGSGKFTDVTKDRAEDLHNLGMVTDIRVGDWDNNGWDDLIAVGDWMPITILKNVNGRFTNVSKDFALENMTGWWHCVEVKDLNEDGKIDFVLGNHGQNSFFKSGDRMYVNDFDRNGSVEQIFCQKNDGRYFSVVDKDELLSQIPSLRKKLLYYSRYAKMSVDELFPKSIFEESLVYQVNELSSGMLLSGTDGYAWSKLPQEAQYSSVYAISINDFDKDGIQDLIMGGNQFLVKPQFGPNDGSKAWFFKGILRSNEFSLLPGQSLNVNGQIRDIEYLKVKDVEFIFFAKYNDQLEIFKIHN